MQLSIITSLFNRLDLTRTYLESLERTLPRCRYEVILIDDGSSDGTREFLQTLPPDRFRIVLNDERRGFAPNNNAGARLARAPLLALLNNDLILLPGWFEPMARLARWIPRAGCIGNVQREPTSGLINHYGIYFDGHGQPLHAGHNEASAPRIPYREWPAVTAACWLIRADVFQRLGGFHEEFRNGLEDVDFCLRAGALGYRHFMANRSVVYHHISASPGRQAYELSNFALFCARWPKRPRLEDKDESMQSAHARRQEGWRYLRKHLARPWRYSYGRIRTAMGKAATPLPSARNLPLAARLALGAGFPAPRRAHLIKNGPKVFLFVHDTVRNPGRSGIQTVVRGLAGAFGRAGAPVGLVVWNAKRRALRPLPAHLSVGAETESLRELSRLGWWKQPARGSWLLLPEVLYRARAAQLVDYVHRHGCRVAAILHDAIPVQHPEFVPPELPAEHEAYLRALSRADLILPVSETSARAWSEFVRQKSLPAPAVQTCTLAGDITKAPRVREVRVSPEGSPIRMLCVSSLEPRKNHRGLLEAFVLACAARPDLGFELDIVGAPYVGSHDIVEAVHRAMRVHQGKLRWHEQLEYSRMRELYSACDFSVYPSVLEGFGLPVIESLWFGRPCLCANFGAMAETAAGGGCLTTDVRSPRDLVQAMIELGQNRTLRENLAKEAVSRPLKSWADYASELLEILSARPAVDNRRG